VKVHKHDGMAARFLSFMNSFARALVGIVIGIMCYAIIYMAYNGQSIRSMAKWDYQEKMDSAIRDLCGKLGQGLTTEAYVSCSRYASDFQHKVEEEISKDNSML
jgi:hypothetical protein